MENSLTTLSSLFGWVALRPAPQLTLWNSPPLLRWISSLVNRSNLLPFLGTVPLFCQSTFSSNILKKEDLGHESFSLCFVFFFVLPSYFVSRLTWYRILRSKSFPWFRKVEHGGNCLFPNSQSCCWEVYPQANSHSLWKTLLGPLFLLAVLKSCMPTRRLSLLSCSVLSQLTHLQIHVSL